MATRSVRAIDNGPVFLILLFFVSIKLKGNLNVISSCTGTSSLRALRFPGAAATARGQNP